MPVTKNNQPDGRSKMAKKSAWTKKENKNSSNPTITIDTDLLVHPQRFHLSTKASSLLVCPSGAFGLSASNFEKLWAGKPPSKDKIMMYGREVFTPRYLKLYGPDVQVTVSGTTFTGAEWPDIKESDKADKDNVLGRAIREALNFANSKYVGSSAPYNAVVVNWYSSAEDYIGYHADVEKGIDHTYPIVGVTLLPGKKPLKRKFTVKRKVPMAERVGRGSNKLEKTLTADITLGHGAIIAMEGKFQQEYKHAVPKVSSGKSKNLELDSRRISLTVRKYDVS